MLIFKVDFILSIYRQNVHGSNCHGGKMSPWTFQVGLNVTVDVTSRHRLSVHDKVDLLWRALELYEGAFSKYAHGLSEDPSAMIDHEEHHQLSLLIIHIVTGANEGATCGEMIAKLSSRFSLIYSADLGMVELWPKIFLSSWLIFLARVRNILMSARSPLNDCFRFVFNSRGSTQLRLFPQWRRHLLFFVTGSLLQNVGCKEYEILRSPGSGAS